MVYDAIRDSLSGPMRFKAMPALNKIKDAANIDVAMQYVKDVTEEQDRRDLTAHIIHQYHAIMSSPSVRVEFRDMARTYLTGVQLKAPKAR
jgi:hypothetical protein